MAAGGNTFKSPHANRAANGGILGSLCSIRAIATSLDLHPKKLPGWLYDEDSRRAL